MKSVFKKIISVSLMIIMLLSALPFTASAKSFSGKCGENLTWTFDESSGELVISGTGEMYDYDYNNRPWESYEDSVKSIIIDDDVTTIGTSAFYGFDFLTSVIIGESVKYVLENAFYWCKKLTNVTIGNKVTVIGEYAFSHCESLTDLTLPDTVTAIGNGAFNSCFLLKQILVPHSVTIIGDYAFYKCYKLTGMTIPNSLITIGRGAFCFCSNLYSVTIPSSVTAIGENAFNACLKLAKITVEDSNKYYSSDSYGVLYNKEKTELIKYPAGNKGTSYNVPSSVASVEGNAFYCCDSLTSIEISDSVTSIGSKAFSSCSNLKDAHYFGDEVEWNSIKIEKDNDSLLNADIHFLESDGCNTNVTLPTCTESGYTTYTCECGKVYVDDYVNALGHDFGDWIITTPSTCVSFGVETRCCSRCDETEKQGITKSDHSYVEDVVDPNCTERGYTKYTCFCGHQYIDDYVPQTGHTAGEWIVISPATTTQTGIKTQRCSVCDELLNVDTIPTLPAKVYGVSVSDVSLDYKASTSITLSVNADPGAKYTLTYSSSNPSVATVDENGSVYASGKGNATITVTVTDQFGNKVTDTCDVNVNYTFGQWLIIILLFGWIWY